MKASILIILMLLGVGTINAQKIKVKKDIVYVDDVAYFKANNDFGNETISTLDGKIMLTLKQYSFDKPNPARNNTNDPNRFKYPATIKSYYYVVSFLDFDLEYETDLHRKKLFLAFYKYELIDKSNIVSEEKARKTAQIISKKISGDRPTIIIQN